MTKLVPITNDVYKTIRYCLSKSSNRELVCKELKEAFPCIDCQYNDGKPHSACYNCE